MKIKKFEAYHSYGVPTFDKDEEKEAKDDRYYSDRGYYFGNGPYDPNKDEKDFVSDEEIFRWAKLKMLNGFKEFVIRNRPISFWDKYTNELTDLAKKYGYDHLLQYSEYMKFTKK